LPQRAEKKTTEKDNVYKREGVRKEGGEGVRTRSFHRKSPGGAKKLIGRKTVKRRKAPRKKNQRGGEGLIPFGGRGGHQVRRKKKESCMKAARKGRKGH